MKPLESEAQTVPVRRKKIESKSASERKKRKTTRCDNGLREVINRDSDQLEQSAGAVNAAKERIFPRGHVVPLDTSDEDVDIVAKHPDKKKQSFISDEKNRTGVSREPDIQNGSSATRNPVVTHAQSSTVPSSTGSLHQFHIAVPKSDSKSVKRGVGEPATISQGQHVSTHEELNTMCVVPNQSQAADVPNIKGYVDIGPKKIHYKSIRRGIRGSFLEFNIGPGRLNVKRETFEGLNVHNIDPSCSSDSEQRPPDWLEFLPPEDPLQLVTDLFASRADFFQLSRGISGEHGVLSVSATFSFPKEFALERTMEFFRCVQHSSKHGCLLVRFTGCRATAIIYSSGQIVLTAAYSEGDAYALAKRILRTISRKSGFFVHSSEELRDSFEYSVMATYRVRNVVYMVHTDATEVQEEVPETSGRFVDAGYLIYRAPSEEVCRKLAAQFGKENV